MFSSIVLVRSNGGMVAVARMQLAAGARGLTCAKLGEAEAMLPSGVREMSIDADSYWAWHGTNPGCWQDKGFRDWFKKKNPETVVKYTPRNTTILVS